MSDLDVLCFGEALIDFFAEPAAEPLWSAPSFSPHLGGAPANFAVGMARQGLRAGLMTLVGRDPFGRFVRERLAAEGVDASLVGEHESARTGVTFVSVDASGERSFVFYRHPSADLCVEASDVTPAAIARAGVLHVGSSTLCREPARAATWRALDLARELGRRVTCDVNLRPHLWALPADIPSQVAHLLGRCWVAKLSAEETGPLLDTDDPVEAARRMRARGVEIAVVTLGAAGCVFAAPDGEGAVPGVPADVVDTTGAGDAFMAGLCAGLLRGESVRDACARGNALGARACTAVGATTAAARTGAP